MALLRKVSPTDEPYYGAALLCEERADARDAEITSFFTSPSKRLFINGIHVNLATALDMSYYGSDAGTYTN